MSELKIKAGSLWEAKDKRKAGKIVKVLVGWPSLYIDVEDVRSGKTSTVLAEYFPRRYKPVVPIATQVEPVAEVAGK